MCKRLNTNGRVGVEEGRLGLQWELVGVRQDSGER
jgi:hypothetical protein